MWAPGLAVHEDVMVRSVAFDNNRIEVLRLLLGALCDPLYQSAEDFNPTKSRWLAVATALDVPNAELLFYSLMNATLGFDPVGFIAEGGKKKEEMQMKELANGRAAILGFSGIVTQSALTGNGFPYTYNGVVDLIPPIQGDAPLPSICGSLGYTFWSINRVAWQGDVPSPIEPLAVLKQGRSYILRFRNESPNAHPIHLHGHSFRLLRSNKRPLPPLVTDTVLLLKEETLEVALIADNPGNWAFHCHVIEHQKTGLTGYIRVET